MPPALPAPEISFGRAALCAGVNEKTLRGWLDRKQVTLSAEAGRTGRGWRRFTATDVVRIAIMKRIVDYGFGVEAADAVLCAHFDDAAFTARALAGQFDESTVLQQSLMMALLILCRDGRVALVRGALPHEPVFIIRAGEDPEPVAQEPWRAAKGSEWFLSDSHTITDFCLIRMGAIAEDVGTRLRSTAE